MTPDQPPGSRADPDGRHRPVLGPGPGRTHRAAGHRLRTPRPSPRAASAPPGTPTPANCPTARCGPASAAAIPSPSLNCIRARSCWILVLAAASTCCCRPAGSSRAGQAYGLDAAPDMITLARRTLRRLESRTRSSCCGHIEDIPLPDDHVDVVISNCVINLSADKPRALAAAFRVLRPGRQARDQRHHRRRRARPRAAGRGGAVDRLHHRDPHR